MRILAVTSGRADGTPLQPVIAALWSETVTPIRISVEGMDFSRCASMVEAQLSEIDVVLLLGDRYETLAAAGAATVAGVPIAHIHGGEASYGSFDNQIRDAITKLAHIHFVAAEPMRQRLLDLGEEDHRIHVVGAPGLDNLGELPDRHPEKWFVVTYHPETLGGSNVQPLLDVLKRYGEYGVIWTGVNNDPGSADIKQQFEARGYIHHGWPKDKGYHWFCRHAALVIGNSSSGIIEAPSLEVPTINVGSRQDGRLKGPSIFDCTNDRHDIESCIRETLGYDGPFTNPYGEPGASKKIADILSNVEIDMVKKWRT